MVAMALSAIILAVVGSLTVFTARSFAAIANYVDLDQKSQAALDELTRDIRQVNSLFSYTTNGASATLVFIDYDGQKLQFDYDANRRELRRSKGGPSKIMLTECDRLNFGIYQRNPIGGTYDQFPAGSVGTCKLIQVSWTCSRQIFGAKKNTESVQTAKIVIRNS